MYYGDILENNLIGLSYLVTESKWLELKLEFNGRDVIWLYMTTWQDGVCLDVRGEGVQGREDFRLGLDKDAVSCNGD